MPGKGSQQRRRQRQRAAKQTAAAQESSGVDSAVSPGEHTASTQEGATASAPLAPESTAAATASDDDQKAARKAETATRPDDPTGHAWYGDGTQYSELLSEPKYCMSLHFDTVNVPRSSPRYL